MALCPFAVHKLIAAGSSDPAIEVVGAILHVDAGNAESLFGYFNGPSGGIESHFHIQKDGTIEQYRNTGYEADANYKANSFTGSDGRRKGYVSIETQGYGAGEWTPEQVASIKRLLLWLSDTHGFGLRKATSPYSGGVGYHTLFGAPSAWTPVSKSCPGPDRIKQFAAVLVPWFPVARRPVDKMDPRSYFLGAHGEHVTWLGERLVAHGYDRHSEGEHYVPGPTFTRSDRANVRLAQLKNGATPIEADGTPGLPLLQLLAGPPVAKEVPASAHVAAARPKIHDAIGDLRKAEDLGRGRAGKAADLLRAAAKVLRPTKKTSTK